MMEQFSLMQLTIAILGSSALTQILNLIFSRRKDLATVDATVRNTYGEMVDDLRGQTAFLSEQIKTAQDREMSHLAIIAQQNGTVSSIQAELSASQAFIRNLEAQKHKYEKRISELNETIIKRQEAHSKA